MYHQDKSQHEYVDAKHLNYIHTADVMDGREFAEGLGSAMDWENCRPTSTQPPLPGFNIEHFSLEMFTLRTHPADNVQNFVRG